jgi:hypothetical protein
MKIPQKSVSYQPTDKRQMSYYRGSSSFSLNESGSGFGLMVSTL